LILEASNSAQMARTGDAQLPDPRAIVGQANTVCHQPLEDCLARRRHQRGQLSLRGKREKVWVARWREDSILPNGSIHRVRKCEVIGTLKEYKTRRLAERALEQRLTEVNSLSYKARPTATFAEFAAKWQRDVLTQHKPSTGSGDKSRIKKHLIPELGELCLKDINAQRLQSMVAKKGEKLSAKSVRNLIATLRIMWRQAKAWGYISHDPFDGIVLPDRDLLDERFLSLEEMKLVIENAPEPYRTYYWILAETGIRAGEIGALPVRNLMLDICAIKITQSVWHGKIQTVKSLKGNRLCEISPQLADHLRQFLRTWRPNSASLLFATKHGTPWDTDVVRKRKLYPLLDKLGISRCGFHAFRHGNETVMDQENVPMAVRQERLGHTDARTTMMYSHAVSEDGKRFAAKLGAQLAPQGFMMAAGNA
jgi:integrase